MFPQRVLLSWRSALCRCTFSRFKPARRRIEVYRFQSNGSGGSVPEETADLPSKVDDNAGKMDTFRAKLQLATSPDDIRKLHQSLADLSDDVKLTPVLSSVVQHLVNHCRDTDGHQILEVMGTLSGNKSLFVATKDAITEAISSTGPRESDTMLFNDLLQCCGMSKRYHQMKEVEQLMVDLEVPFNAQTFISLLAYGPKSVPEVQRLLVSLQEYAKVCMQGDAHQAKRDVIQAFCTLMSTFARLKQWAAVESIIETFPHEAEIYVTAISLYGTVAKDFQKMEQMMSRMKMQGFSISNRVLCVAIDAYGRSQKFEKVMQIIRDLEADNRSLSEELCGAVAIALARMGQVTEVQAFLSDMEKRGTILPDQEFQEICLHLINYYGARRDFHMMHSTLAQLQNRKTPLSQRLRRRLLKIYVDSLHLGHLQKFVESIWPLTAEECQRVARAYADAGLHLQAQQVQDGQLPDPVISDAPGLTPARKRWLSWRLVTGRFSEWCQAAVNSQEIPNGTDGVVTMDGVQLGAEEMEYTVQFFISKNAIDELLGSFAIVHRAKIVIAVDTVLAAFQCLATAQRHEDIQQIASKMSYCGETHRTALQRFLRP